MSGVWSTISIVMDYTRKWDRPGQFADFLLPKSVKRNCTSDMIVQRRNCGVTLGRKDIHNSSMHNSPTNEVNAEDLNHLFCKGHRELGSEEELSSTGKPNYRSIRNIGWNSELCTTALAKEVYNVYGKLGSNSCTFLVLVDFCLAFNKPFYEVTTFVDDYIDFLGL